MTDLRADISNDSKDDILTQEIASWFNFSDILRENDRKLFNQMVNECREYKSAIATKGELYSTESTIMTIILIQQKMITELINKNQRTSAAKNNAENNVDRIE